mgnify:CR=1 FL=1
MKNKETFVLVSLEEEKSKKLAQVISNTTSRKILDYLSEKDASQGDIAKAFVAGADFVMLGTMLAGHEENTEPENRDGDTVEMYGMSSKKAMNKYYGEVEKYRTDEGSVGNVPYKGKIERTVQDILGGLRSSCTYVGAKSLEEFRNKAKLISLK